MANDLNLVAASISAALIASDKLDIFEGQSHDGKTQTSVERAVNIYSMVLTELMNRGRAGKLYKEP